MIPTVLVKTLVNVAFNACAYGYMGISAYGVFAGLSPEYLASLTIDDCIKISCVLGGLLHGIVFFGSWRDRIADAEAAARRTKELILSAWRGR